MKIRAKLLSLIASLSLLVQSLSPFLKIIPVVRASQPITSMISFDNDKNVFTISINTDKNVEYLLSYYTGSQIEGVKGSGKDESGSFTREIYAGIKSGSDARRDTVLRGIFKLQAGNEFLNEKKFIINQGNLVVVYDDSTFSLNLSEEDEYWLKNGENPSLTLTPTPIFTPTEVQSSKVALTPTITVNSFSIINSTQDSNNSQLTATIIKNTKTETFQLNLDPVNTSDTPTLVTDKPDYSPTETVVISGYNFTPNKNYALLISSTDSPPVNFRTTVITDEQGGFVYLYQLDGNYRPNYLVQVRDNLGKIISSTTFTDTDTEFFSPTAGIGSFKKANEAFSDGSDEASSNNSGENQQYYNYNISIPPNATINGITVRLDAWRDNDASSGSFSVQLSWDGGSSWTTSKNTGGLSTSETSYLLGGTSDTWERVWSTSELSNGNFRVKVTSAITPSNKKVYLDWIPVKISYTETIPIPTPTNTPTPTSTLTPTPTLTSTVTPTPTSTPASTPTPTLTVTPTPTPSSFTCVPDTTGANDEPGQKDLTKLCRNLNQINPLEINWNWDEVSMSGNNTADGCALFDTDNDGLANYSLCVTWDNGQRQVSDSPKLYSCNDTKADRCAGADNGTTLSGICSVADASDDPFPTGDGYPHDTKATCSIPLSSIGGPNQAYLLDVCSYPSTQPNSDPSDCVIIRPDKGNLTIIKDVIPDNEDTNWNFAVDGPTNYNISIIGDGQASNPVDLGTYSITETAGANTDLNHYTTSWSCTKNGNPYLSGTGTTISNVMIGKTGNVEDSVICLFTNSLKQGTLIIKKTVINDNGGEKNASDFSFSVNGASPVVFESDGENELTVAPGQYTITESAVTGYDTSYSNCSNLNIVAGETVTCTITNDDQPGTLVVRKVLIGSNDTFSNFSFSINNGPRIGFEEDGENQILVNAGNYTVTETSVDEYIVDYDNCSNLNIGNGELATCTITNTKKGSIIIKKDMIGDVDTFEFTGTPSGSISTDLGTIQAVVVPGQYTSTETDKAGWDLNSITCDDSNSVGNISNRTATFNVEAGETVTCTFTNTLRGKIIIEKQTTPNDNDTAYFDFSTNYKQNFILKNMGTDDSGFLVPGTYTVTELAKPGWDLTGVNCTEDKTQNTTTNLENRTVNIVLEPGETVHCIFDNTQRGSISGYKWEDINGDGEWSEDEPGINGWTIFIDKDSDGILNDEEISLITTDSGYYKFENLTPGTYTVCEVSQTGWVRTNASDSSCQTVTVNPGEETKSINFGNFKLGKVTVTKFHDRNQDGNKDSDEEVLSDWEVKLTSSDSGTLTQTTNAGGQSLFNNLLAGNYNLSENLQTNWEQTNIYCDNYQGTYKDGSYSLTISSAADLDCYIGNYNQVVTTLSKSNNIYPNSAAPGSVVTFTLKLKVQGNNLYNAYIKDILPPYFSFNNVWSATVNGTSVALPNPNYASPGTWQLGDLKENDEVIITYQAKVGGAAEPGLYKDLAWAAGTKKNDEASDKVLALAVDSGTSDPGIVTENFVGTKVYIDKDTQNYTSVNIKNIKKEESGEVLGAATSLPATGGKVIWLIIASLLSFFGLFFVIVGLRIKKISKFFSKILSLLIILGFYLLITNKIVLASSLSVRLSEPKSPTRISDFDLNFVALDLENSPITVKCFYKKEGNTYSQFDTIKILSAGGGSGSCRVTGSQLNEEKKTYSFYVEASNGVQTVYSEIVSVDYKTSTPGTPTNYSKDHPAACMYKIKFKTADDGGLTKKVEVYRSKETNFPLDSSTRVASIPLGSNTEYIFTDTVPDGYCNDNWYYAMRAFDDAGNGSGWVGDSVVTVTTVSTVATYIPGQGLSPAGGAILVTGVTIPPAEVTGQPEVLGEKTATQEGQPFKKEEKKKIKSIGEILGEAVKKENGSKTIFIGLGLLLIVIIGYAIYKIKNQKSKIKIEE